MRHFQCTTNPLNPPCQGDFRNFERLGVIGKCPLISRVYYKRKVSEYHLVNIETVTIKTENFWSRFIYGGP